MLLRTLRAIFTAGFLLMLCFCLLGTAVFGQPAPKVMTRMVVQFESPDLPPDSFAKQPKTMYRAGNRYCRIEEALDAKNAIHGLAIINEPDAWFVNLAQKTGRHQIDPGPTFNCRLPIFGGNGADPIPGLEFGQELAYFKEKGVTPVPGPELYGKPTKVYEIDAPNYQLLLFTDSGSGRPMAIKRGQGAKRQIYLYTVYEERPFDASLFTKPADMTIEESK